MSAVAINKNNQDLLVENRLYRYADKIAERHEQILQQKEDDKERREFFSMIVFRSVALLVLAAFLQLIFVPGTIYTYFAVKSFFH